MDSTPDTDDQPVMYFGPPSLRKPDERQVPAPVGELCLWCYEAIAAGDMGTLNQFHQIHHYECLLRAMVGSVGHQERRCSCHGGTEEDPPGMTRREAALAAAALYHRRN